MDPASASRVLLAKAYVFCHILKTQRLVCMSCACFLDKSTCRGMYCLVVSGRPWRPTRPATMRGQQQTRVQPGTAVKPIVDLVPDTVLASLMHHAARRALCQSRLGRRQQQPRTMGLGGSQCLALRTARHHTTTKRWGCAWSTAPTRHQCPLART